MFGISFSELLIIFLIILVVFGPDRLPQIANMLGKAWGEFNRKSNELKRELTDAASLAGNNNLLSQEKTIVVGNNNSDGKEDDNSK